MEKCIRWKGSEGNRERERERERDLLVQLQHQGEQLNCLMKHIRMPLATLLHCRGALWPTKMLCGNLCGQCSWEFLIKTEAPFNKLAQKGLVVPKSNNAMSNHVQQMFEWRGTSFFVVVFFLKEASWHILNGAWWELSVLRYVPSKKWWQLAKAPSICFLYPPFQHM